MCVGKMFWGGLVEYRLVGGLDLPLPSIFMTFMVAFAFLYSFCCQACSLPKVGSMISG